MTEILIAIGTVGGGFVGYYLKHIRGMKELENAREENIINVVINNTKAMTSVEGAVNSVEGAVNELKTMVHNVDTKLDHKAG